MEKKYNSGPNDSHTVWPTCLCPTPCNPLLAMLLLWHCAQTNLKKSISR